MTPTEAALIAALQEIAVGKTHYDNEHPLGPDASMAGRFLEIAKKALAAPAHGKDAGEEPDLRAQLAAAQARAEEFKEASRMKAGWLLEARQQLQAATERAEKAERALATANLNLAIVQDDAASDVRELRQERDAAIKAKEEADAKVSMLEGLAGSLRDGREEERSRAEMLSKVNRVGREADAKQHAADLSKAEATAESLRAALERVKEALGKDSVSQAWDAAYEALAAHSKAVGP